MRKSSGGLNSRLLVPRSLVPIENVCFGGSLNLPKNSNVIRRDVFAAGGYFHWPQTFSLG